MGQIGPDITREQLQKEYSDAIRIIHEQREEVETLKKSVSILKWGLRRIGDGSFRGHSDAAAACARNTLAAYHGFDDPGAQEIRDAVLTENKD